MSINWTLYQKAFEYGTHIIYEAPDFLKFSMELADYMGEDIIEISKDVYSGLYTLACLPKTVKDKMDSLEEVEKYDLDYIYYKFSYFKKEQERDRQKEFKENIDELQFLVKSYRQKDEFKKMLEFIGKFNYLSPYNAMLVEMQKPGSTFVFSGRKWAKDYGRIPKVNAQRLITLVPFGPIQCLFDFSDTEPIEGEYAVSETELMDEWDKSLTKTKGEIPQEELDNLIHNLPQYGVYLDDQFNAANTYGGYIMEYSDRKLDILIGKDSLFQHVSRFLISVNKNQDNANKFATICHELGHLFCCHQSYNRSKKRRLTAKEREFEAETVAWLMCKRHGIYNPSEEYLATFAPEGEIPVCSTEIIMKAVSEIEKMLEGPVRVKDSLWYKEDKNFKEDIDKAIKK